MTLVVGFRRRDHNILIAADSRISWRRGTVHVDEVQKIYLPASEVAIAFSGNDVEQIQRALRAVRAEVEKEDFASEGEPTAKYNNRVLRVVTREAASIMTEASLMVGILHPTRPEANVLRLITIDNGSVKDWNARVGVPLMRGSAFSEEPQGVMEADIRQAFESCSQDELPNGDKPDIFWCADWLSTQYALVLHRLSRMKTVDGKIPAEGLDTAGPLLQIVVSYEGSFAAFPTAVVGAWGDKPLRFGTTFDPSTGKFGQHNSLTGQSNDLYTVDEYDFSKVPGTNYNFTVMPRGS